MNQKFPRNKLQTNKKMMYKKGQSKVATKKHYFTY